MVAKFFITSVSLLKTFLDVIFFYALFEVRSAPRSKLQMCIWWSNKEVKSLRFENAFLYWTDCGSKNDDIRWKEH